MRNYLRVLANAKIPFIMFSCYQKGGTGHENIDIGSEWSIGGNCRIDFAFD
jgi:hypothetical protein